MLTLTRTITCNLPDDEDILELLKAKHEEQPFISYDDIFRAVLNVVSDYADDEAYDFFWDDIQDYVTDITDTFWESHPEIYE